MKLIEFIALDLILVDVEVDSKKNLFKLVSNFFAKNDFEEGSKIIEKLKKTLKSISYEIIFVDDNSPDGTSKEVKNFMKNKLSFIE